MGRKSHLNLESLEAKQRDITKEERQVSLGITQRLRENIRHAERSDFSSVGC